MTLVVANSIKEKIRIISDSKKTSEEEILKGLEHSLLKAVIINPTLCVCFAGKIGPAQVAIEKLGVSQKGSFDLDSVLDHFLLAHLECNKETDFIVAALSPTTTLSRIASGKIDSNLPACWIGNKDAFSEYQKQFHTNQLLGNLEIQGAEEQFYALVIRMEMAFRAVTEDNTHQDVGDLSISVMNDHNGFIYATSANTSFRNQTIPSHTWTVLEHGSTAEGGYSYSIMAPLEAGIGAVGLHFYQGGLGALFYPVKSANAIVYTKISADQFKDKVREDFGFEIEGLRIN